MARPIDANAMLDELRPVSFEAEHSAVLLSDVSKMMREWVERQPTLTPPNEPEHVGLYGKYTVYKNKDGSLVTDCFILRPAKDPAAVAALRAYAATTDNAEFAADIICWIGAEPNEPLTLDELLKMDGQPVYVVFRPGVSGEKPQFWALVSVDEWNDVYLANKEGWAFNYEKFLEDVEGIYRRPPEGEEDA